MGKPNLKAVTGDDASPRSPERAALAAAIDRHNAATRYLAANETAQQRTFQTIRDARRAVEAATAAIDEAKANAARHLTDTAMGTAGNAPLTVKDARAKVQDAEDALEAAICAQSALVEQQKAAESDLQYARMALDYRVRDVVKAEANAGALVSDYVALHRDLVNRRRVLEFLNLRDTIPKGLSWQGEGNWPDLPGAAPWRNAVTALESDPDAPLPN